MNSSYRLVDWIKLDLACFGSLSFVCFFYLVFMVQYIFSFLFVTSSTLPSSEPSLVEGIQRPAHGGRQRPGFGTVFA